MKKLLILICLFAAGIAHAQQQQTMFPYPTAPDDMATLSQRCNYVVEHFWDRCNIKQSFSSQPQLREAFGDWIKFMPYASSDTVYMAINAYMDKVSKTGGDNVATIGRIAESWLYCDTAAFFSEDVYLPFAKAVAGHKKVDNATRQRLQAQIKILENSRVGAKAGGFEFVTRADSTMQFDDVVASRVILFFYDPDCTDCSLVKTRMSVDFNLNQLLDGRLVKIVAIYPGEPTQEWRESAALLPESWIVGAAPDIDLLYDIPTTPDLYYLDARHKILAKHVDINNLLIGVQQINQQLSK
ncbi:MAG: DUF5106 domain-containing protein [Muribaculaceae bacterium]|nr:DUF5106 domain-containing protein [Muribaculaceae bacterium]